MKPATTQMIIYGAVGAGAVLVLISIIMNIFSCIKQKKAAHSVFSSNGVAGILFYLSVFSLLFLENAQTFAIPVIIVTLLLMFFCEPLTRLIEKKKPLEKDQSVSDFIMQTFFELFETVLSYVTNTMSFLRVGAFILVHAGMMKVVFTLAEMSSGAPYVIILIIGNAQVLCLEALLVGIQVLRLEFYEMFSRFYTGEGEAYAPVSEKETV
jgi:V/A-type H+-transporting ATPase subunit I